MIIVCHLNFFKDPVPAVYCAYGIQSRANKSCSICHEENYSLKSFR